MESNALPAWADTPPVQSRVISALGRLRVAMRAAQWQFCSAHGLTPTQLEVLLLLLARPEGVRLSVVAAQLAVTAATASDAVSTLVVKGLLSKARDPDDGRALALRLTSLGEEMAGKASQATRFVDEALSQLPSHRQERLLEGLLALIGQLQRHPRFPATRACPACQHFEADRHAQAPQHHCHLVNAPLPSTLLRVDCPEHRPASPGRQHHNWSALA